MRKIIYAATLSKHQKSFLVWLGVMLERAWAQECFEQMGQIPRVQTGVPKRVARLKALGNGQVSRQAAEGLIILSTAMEKWGKEMEEKDAEKQPYNACNKTL